MPPEQWQIPPPDVGAAQGVRECFIAFLTLNDPDKMRDREYSFHQFAQICGRTNPDEDYINLSRYLVSLGVLKVFYLFQDNNGDLSEKYSAREILEAEQFGSLVHPQTGEEVKNFEARVFPFLKLCRPQALPER